MMKYEDLKRNASLASKSKISDFTLGMFVCEITNSCGMGRLTSKQVDELFAILKYDPKKYDADLDAFAAIEPE